MKALILPLALLLISSPASSAATGDRRGSTP
jgi:hypothetical protein